ncbi:Histidine biosynthesis bifunctional protein hisB, partial [Podila verticillata]
AGEYFRNGADKVSIGSDAVYAAEKYYALGGRGDGTSAIETIAHAYGSQAVVISVDPKRVYVFEKTGVEAALAAGIFHRREVPLEEVKDVCREAGIRIRAVDAALA